MVWIIILSLILAAVVAADLYIVFRPKESTWTVGQWDGDCTVCGTTLKRSVECAGKCSGLEPAAEMPCPPCKYEWEAGPWTTGGKAAPPTPPDGEGIPGKCSDFKNVCGKMKCVDVGGVVKCR